MKQPCCAIPRSACHAPMSARAGLGGTDKVAWRMLKEQQSMAASKGYPQFNSMHKGSHRTRTPRTGTPHLDGGMRGKQVKRVLHIDELLLDGAICGQAEQISLPTSMQTLWPMATPRHHDMRTEPQRSQACHLAEVAWDPVTVLERPVTCRHPHRGRAQYEPK